MHPIVQLIVLGILVEAIWETLKMVWEQGHIEFDRVGAIIVGLVIALAMGIDIFDVIGLASRLPFVGVIATGILISRGGNFIHDLLKKAEGPSLQDDIWLE